MGFGLLFLGYFFVTFLTLNKIGSIMRVIGYGLIVVSSLKLNKYQRSFSFMGIGAVLMLVLSVILVFSDVSRYLYDNLLISALPISDGYRVTIGYIEQGLSFVFNAAMLWAIRKIAIDTDVPKISANAIRNFVFICFYYFVYLLSFLPVGSIQSVAKELTMIAWILYIVWMILNVLLIFSCYSRICDENDVDMAQKPSRFAFVNRFREELDRRQQKAYEESLAYKNEKRERKKRRRKK